MKPKYALEDLIYEMEARNADRAPSEDLDIYAQLQEKEKDLILAAELGKALLSKNEELQKQIKDLTDDSSKRIEMLEQERHISRRKLESTQEECDSKIAELQSDLTQLKKNLDFRETSMKQMEREKSQLIQDLTAQNQRLQAQLKESGKAEESLSSQLNSLRDQCNLKKSSLIDRESSMEVLRDEITLLTDRKTELERRLTVVTEERDALNTLLDECQERIRMLERHTREQDSQLRASSREIERLQTANAQLGDKLDAINSMGSPRCRSLLNEMECDEDYHTSSFSNVFPEQWSNPMMMLEKEVVSCYEALRGICNSLRIRSISESESSDHSMLSDLNLSEYKVGLLTSAIEELESLLQQCGRVSGLDGDLEIELHKCKEAIDRLEKDLIDTKEELKNRSEIIQELTGKLSMKEAELKVAEEAVDTARADLVATGTADQQVQAAREARDTAVSRKAELELQLARSRIDVLQANSQLMEVVQQKVELSQQLEQWQVDMQCLLDEQMKEKLGHQEKKRSTLPPPPTAPPRNRIMSFFR